MKASFSQLLTTVPDFPTDNSSLSIIVDCTKGNQGLMNYGNTNDVYVHIGVITSLSTGNGDWKYVKFDWGTANPLAKATYLGNNKYQYDIANVRNFFGVPAGETIRKIAILFRSGNGNQVQRNSNGAIDGGDMYLTIYGSALAAKFKQPPYEPYFIPTPEPITKTVGSTVDINYKAKSAAQLQLFFNGTQIQNLASADSVMASPTITVSGNQQVVGRATIGAVSVSDTFNFFVTPTTVVAALPAGVRDGINYLQGDTSVVLVLFAPGKDNVNVIGDFNNWTQSAAYQMKKTPDGKYFWIQVNGLTAGTEYAYQFLINNTLRVADYYAEKLLDPNNDPSIPAATYPNLKPYPTGKTTDIVSVLQTASPQYNWRNGAFNRPDKRNLVVYELLVRDFTAAHDFKTIKDTLSYLKRLGVNAIELMPVNEFQGNNSWGYNTSFYFAVDKYYGPKNSLKELIDSCHSNGIAVIMDMVLNHSYEQSPMVKMYFDNSTNRPSADNPWFNPVAPHSAITFGYDFNHESDATKYFVSRVTSFWQKEFKIDGFRFDFTKGFTQKATTNDAQLSAYDASRIAILKRISDSVQANSANSYVILEHLCDNTEEKELAAAGMMLWGNGNFTFNEASMGWVGTSNFEWFTHTARGYTQPLLLSYMESHDEERLMYKNIKYGNSSVASHNVKDTLVALKRNELTAAFYLAMPGPRMIWQFGEVGYDISRCYLSTNGEGGDCNTKLNPKPIRWDYQNKPERRKLFDAYASIIKLRKNFPATFTNGTLSYNLNGAFKSMQLTATDLTLVVVGNFDVNATSGTVTFPSAGTWYTYPANEPITATGSAQTINLPAGEYRYYINKNLNPPPPPPPPPPMVVPTAYYATVYPNPVTASSKLVVGVPYAGRITMAVFDATGKELARYDFGQRAAGTYPIPISNILRDRALAAGIYTIHLNVGQYAAVRRLVIQRH